MAGAANRVAGTELDLALLEAEAVAEGRSFLEQWALGAQDTQIPSRSDLRASHCV